MTSIAAGTVLGGCYQVLRPLGEGGMGSVYEAVQLDLERRVAIKVLQARYARDPHMLARFQREALASGRLQHPNIAQTTAFVADGHAPPFIVMELVHGEPLRNVLMREHLGARRAARIGMQVLDALELAHSNGIVHRDLKPGNLMVQSTPGMTDFVKLLDFGIAKVLDEDRYTCLTRTGSVIGTPGFMAPEQARGGVIDGRTDLYALGMVLYRAVAGRFPFAASNETALLLAILHEPPLPLSIASPGIDPSFAALVDRAIRRAPEERFPNTHAMRTALAPIANGHDASHSSPIPASAVESVPAPAYEIATRGPRRTPIPSEPPPAHHAPAHVVAQPSPEIAPVPPTRAQTPTPSGRPASAALIWPIVSIAAAVVGVSAGVGIVMMIPRAPQVSTAPPQLAQAPLVTVAPPASASIVQPPVANQQVTVEPPKPRPPPLEAAPELATPHVPEDVNPTPPSRTRANRVRDAVVEAPRDRRLEDPPDPPAEPPPSVGGVRLTRCDVDGWVEAQFRSFLRPSSAAVQQCFDSHAPLDRTFFVQLFIGPDGSFDRVMSGLDNAGDACLVQAYARVRLPPPANGEVQLVNLGYSR